MDRSTTTYQGDLTDIVLKASGGCGGGGSDAALSQSTSDISTWQFSCDDSHNTTGASTDFDQFSIDYPIFGDPFCNIRDPLLHELNLAATGSTYFSNNFGSVDDHMVAASTSSACDQVLFDSNDDNSNCSMFSRIQISLDDPVSKFPVNSSFPVVVTAAAADCHSSPSGFKGVISCDNQMISVNSPKGSLIDHPGLVQIPSPRNLGIKRRKGQAKKVVCIPAPAAANNRPNSEVVPSDLWAWRKYGQKPIKGSPYPRGYYRCSSSKGCSARKQVERSRTDPNMLVITYTSEHNHPWPTQRNVLAGSTRSPHPSKTDPNSSVNHSKTNKTTSTNKQDHKADTTSNNVSGTTSFAVKLEHEDHGRHTIGYSSNIAAANYREISMLPYHDTTDQDHDQFIITSNTDDQTYRPRAILMADQRSCGQPSEDFFAELGEIDSDPLDDHLLFNHHDDNQHQGFGGDHDQTSNALDPFMSSIIYDWSVNSSNNNSTSSFGEAEETSKVTSTNSDI